MIIATAGHVDHGKTTLLQAITGVNADRLPEEKKRGMTIDLGYAYWPQPDGRVLGFIDVPGHEKFLSNMLAGVGGIDHALLVVACDDGVMAQTREHLAILQLTGNPTLTVALTKADRVDEARIGEVERQVKEVLREYGLLMQNCLSPQQPKGGELMPCVDICSSCRNANMPVSKVSVWPSTVLLRLKGQDWW